MDQTLTPLVSALKHYAERPHAPFYTPGHKAGKGSPEVILDLIGARALRADLPELPGLDNLFLPEGVIQQAQQLAAAAFGAEHTWFLANGSTCGLEAAVLATCNPGDKIVLPRNIHQSAISALILSGAVPIFVQPEYDPVWDLAHGPTPEAIALALETHPDAKAVLIVSPTYYGVCADVAAIANLAHQHSIPLIVDEAHGPHFAFHPDLPPAALSCGADVVVQSTHKVLSALTQAAMLHAQGSKVNRDRLSQALQLVQSTSPNYLLLASLDAARQQMAQQGHTLMSQTLQLAQQARQAIQAIPKLKVFTPSPSTPTPGCHHLDPTRLTVDVSGLGITGFEADEFLNDRCNVLAELPTLRHLTFIISLGNHLTDIQHLIQSFTHLSQQAHSPNSLPHSPSAFTLLPSASAPTSLSPRAAFFSPTETVPLAEAVGRMSAELVCPYPPGIPVLVPGEQVTKTAIATLQAVLQAGGIITGCADPELGSLKVVRQ